METTEYFMIGILQKKSNKRLASGSCVKQKRLMDEKSLLLFLKKAPICNKIIGILRKNDFNNDGQTDQCQKEAFQ